MKNQKKGIPVGIYSNCTANDYVITAIFEKCLEDSSFALIEATANQVNQFGGYTGMSPKSFKDFVYNLAEKAEFPKEKIILGGDHLGPLTWKNEHADSAMKKAMELIRQFVLAGFTKIHIDTSMHLADDDPTIRLSDEIIAHRGAVLCEIAEQAFAELIIKQPDAFEPVFIIGGEVPIPGGSQDVEELLTITSEWDFEKTLLVYKDAFYLRNLQHAWDNVVAVVVQPGVEFSDESVHEYNRDATKSLCGAIKKHENIVFEGHSTDYQTAEHLKQMIEDGVAILKVGPALTFALREGLIALEMIERELYDFDKCSNFMMILENTMLSSPSNWQNYYQGTLGELKIKLRYSYSDRSRYYLPDPEVNAAIKKLIFNLSNLVIPITLISQYMPLQYTKIRVGILANNAESLLKDKVKDLLNDYCYAIKP